MKTTNSPTKSKVTRRAYRPLLYTDSPAPWQHIASAVLLKACLDAHEGRADALEWLHGETARQWAAELDLVDWPPAPEQLAGWRELKERARYEPGVDESPGPLRIRSRNPADLGPLRFGPAVVDTPEWAYSSSDAMAE